MDENSDQKLIEDNINNIKKDEERLKLAKQASLKTEDKYADEGTDIDDLSKYTHVADGVKVLNDTSSINRKAIFHDLDRIKHWRESMEKTSPEPTKMSSSVDNTITEEPIMDQNVDLILNSLPAVDQGTSHNEEAAVKKLDELQQKLERKYSLQKGE